MALPLGELARERLRGRSPFGGAGERSEPERVTVPLGKVAKPQALTEGVPYYNMYYFFPLFQPFAQF